MLSLNERREIEVKAIRLEAAEWARKCRLGGANRMADEAIRDGDAKAAAIEAMNDEAYAVYRAAKMAGTRLELDVVTAPLTTRTYSTRGELERAA